MRFARLKLIAAAIAAFVHQTASLSATWLQRAFTELLTTRPRGDLIVEFQIQKATDLNSEWLN